MIDIVRYRELLAELHVRVNTRCEDQIAGIVIAVRETHMVKKLKDKTGLILCANYPDAESKGAEDNWEEKNSVLLFLLEKVADGSESAEDELQHFARIQRVMNILKEELRNMDFVCGEISADDEIRTEWEYDVFGGYNGLSIGLKLTDYD